MYAHSHISLGNMHEGQEEVKNLVKLSADKHWLVPHTKQHYSKQNVKMLASYSSPCHTVCLFFNSNTCSFFLTTVSWGVAALPELDDTHHYGKWDIPDCSTAACAEPLWMWTCADIRRRQKKWGDARAVHVLRKRSLSSSFFTCMCGSVYISSKTPLNCACINMR